MTSPPYKKLKPWHEMLKKGELEPVTLEPGYFLSNEEINKKHNHKYLDAKLAKRLSEISKSTILWYPPGVHNHYPHVLYKGEQREIAGVFLKGVLPLDKQEEALAGLEKMRWHGPTRVETKTAVARQKGKIAPKELTLGMIRPRDKRLVMPSNDTKKNVEPLKNLVPLWDDMAACFARVLPEYFRLHNSPRAQAAQQPGGIPDHLRKWFLPGNNSTPFSTVTLLRSCPASIHKDRNANKWQHNYACLTSIGERDEKGKVKFSGGRLCLVEYGLKVPVAPGDLLIVQSTREWHYNVDPVAGVKYSIICYYQPRLGNIIFEHRTFAGEVIPPAEPPKA